MFLDVSNEVFDFLLAEVLEGVESLDGEELCGADSAAVAPSLVSYGPG